MNALTHGGILSINFGAPANDTLIIFMTDKNGVINGVNPC